MRAMILAAGRGERMRPLTDTTPKPLLQAGGKPLIVWHIERLVHAGLHDIVINHAWLGQQIEDALGDGAQFGARLHYSAETTPLETAGGIAHTLPFFQDQAFLVINGDIWCDWDPALAHAIPALMRSRNALAWLLLVDNPDHHPDGDFILANDGTLEAGAAGDALTFAGIGVYEPRLFDKIPAGRPWPLAPLLRQAMSEGQVIGAHHRGQWTDVGTPARLLTLDKHLAARVRARYTLGCF